MKNASKILCLLAVSAFVTACNSDPKPPVVISLDLSNAIALFNGNCTTEGRETSFALYKVDEKGVTSRVSVKTKKSDDDPYFYEDFLFADLKDVSDEYFLAELGCSPSNRYINNCFVNKKTGQAYKLDGDYVNFAYDYWLDSTNPMRDFAKDGNGSYYTRAYDRKIQSYVLAKFTVTDKKVKVENIGTLPEVRLNSDTNCPFNEFAVDKDGNIAYRGALGTGSSWRYVTADKKELPIDSRMAVWTGYDGEIYAYRAGNIEKLSYNKDTNQVEATIVKEYPYLQDANLLNMKILYIDKTQQIYGYTTGSNYEFVLHQLYGDNALEEPLVFTVDDISRFDASSNPVISKDGYAHSSVDCDEDCIYIGGKDGNNFVINKIDTTKNMELSQAKYYVEYNDGTRYLNNKKGVVFYWNSDSEINCPPGKSTAAMSVGILDLNTGEITKQDSFVTGNSDRSSVINLKSYK